MAAAKGGYDFGYHNYNTAPENNVSNGISGPTPLPPTPSLNEKNKFTRCPLPPEFIDLVDDDVRDSRVPHQHGPHGKLHPTSSMNPFNPGCTPHSVPTSSGQQTLRIGQPNASPCYSNMLPQMKPYQYEPPLPGRTNQSGLVFSDISATAFLNGTVPDTGSPLTSKLPVIGRCRSEIGANLMTTPQTSSYHAIQQNISNNSHDHFPTYSMPPYSRQLDCSSLPLDSDLSRINFEMLPQRGGLMNQYPSVTTSPQVGPFQFEKPQYGRMRPDMGFPSSIMSSPAGFLPSEQPNSLTNGLCMGSSHMVMTQLTNSAHIEHQECSTTQSGTGTSFPNMALMQPQETSHQNSALLTTPNPKPSSAPDILTQESEAEGTPYQEVIPTEEVATNQVAMENHGIDLNKTPQQKPRRKKYVPKVITPGKKTRAPKKTTPKDSEDRPKRKYVRKKVVEPPPTEAPVNAVGADKPVGNPNSFTQNNSNQSGGADKQTEGSNSCTPIAVNVQNKAAEVPMPCTPSVTTGPSKPTNSSNPCTNIMMQVPDHCSVSGMSGPSKPVRRRLDFDAHEVRTDGYKHTQSQPNLTPFLADPTRRDISTLPVTSSSVQVGPSPSKGISLDLNSTANWQEEFDHLFPPTPSTSTASQLQTIRSTNPMPTNLDNFTGYPYPPVPNQTNSSIAAPKRPVNHCLGTYNENLDVQAKNNESSQIGAYSNAAILTPDGRKREYSALLNNTCLPARVRPQVSPLIIETSKKTRICNGYNTGQNGTAYNAPVFHNSSSILPSLRPDGRMFSLADAQRLVELQKRNKTNMLSFRVPEGNTEKARTVPSGSGIASTSSTPVSQPQAVNGSAMARIYHPGVSVQTFVERTTILNQCMNTSGTLPCRPVTPVSLGVNGATLEMITGRGNMNATNANVRNASCQIGATTQTISETTTEKPVPGNCIQPSTPAKSPTLNASSKSEPKRRGRRPNSEKLGAQPPVPPRPRGRPREKSSIGSTNVMVGGPVSLAYTLDSIIQKMSRLDINRVFETAPVQGPVQPSFALVPYQGGFKDGSIVLYDNVMVKKKRKSRAQVDLDPVTSQVWNLLMGKEMKIGIETVNENDEKKMEAEREVFRGRIDSFIARMHLVQGDRRFSKWKGSVVDSVVGVFLTQNVSDHLSSSAFMALASKYPVKTRPNNSEARESTLSVSRHHNTNPYARDFINLTKWHRQREVIIEDFTDIGSQVTSEEKDSNGSQDSTTKGPGSSLEKKPTGSPDSGPGLVINFSNDDPASDGVVSSQNSVITNQSSPDHPFQTAEQNLPGLGLFGNYRADGHVGDASLPVSGSVGTCPESYTQLLRMAESSGVGFSSDLNKVTGGAGVDVCFYSNVSQLYSQNGNICPGTPSKFSNSNMNHLQNGVYPPPAAPTMVSGNKIVQTQTQDNELRRGLHSSVVSQTPKPVTPMIKITTTPGQTNGYIPVQQEKKIYPPPVQPPSTPSTSNLKSAPNANNNRNTDASSETVQGKQPYMAQKALDGTVIDDGVSSKGNGKKGKGASGRGKKNFDWDSLRRAVCPDGVKKERTHKTMDSLDYEALRNASVRELSDAIRERGMNNMLAERIKGFLDRLVNDHGSIDLEWLRDVDPDKAKDYLLSVRGLGLKSVECVRLLTLHHMAFPVDTNVGRICVRLGWVPLQPLPESLQLHLLEMYPILENIQKYLWPRLCKFDQRTLYELHYQMITFGKVFCTKSKPNCNACPMRAECKHFASAFASARLALPAPEEKGLATATALPSGSSTSTNLHSPFPPSAPLHQIEGFSTLSSSLPVPFPYPIPANLPFQNQPHSLLQPRVSHPTVTPTQTRTQTCNEPIIEEPASPEPEPVAEKEIGAIEDAFLEEDPDEIPTIKLDFKEFTQNLKNYIQANNLEIEDTNMSKAMVAISPEAASLPVPKLKNVSRLRTEHQVYELPDNHTLLAGFEPREPDDPSPYLLSIWTPGETAMSTEPPKSLCISQDVDELCDKEACARCASIKEARSRIVRGTILIPCRTAMRGSFPLNGTYFQVNEVFADHESSRNPIEISRAWIWNLPRRTVYFGTSIPTIFKGQSTEGIQHCFWRGFVCVRGFERATRAPRPLYARLHFPASKVARNGRKPAAAAKNEE